MSTAAAGSGSATGIPDALTELFEALNAGDVRWSLLRPRETLALAQGDIDVLVAPPSMQRLRQLLAARAFVEIPRPGRDVHAVRYDGASGRFLWIHAQPALEIAGSVLSADDVLADVAAGDVPQPGDDWLLWILLLRALVDKGELAERHRPHVATLAARWTRGPAALESLARHHGLQPPEIVALAAAERWDALLARSVFTQAPPVTGPARLIGVLKGVRSARGRIGRRGLSVAVLGPDGAGKTTLIEGLSHSLPVPTRIQYMGLTGGLLPKADALRVPGLIFAARAAIIWQRYLRGRLYRARGRFVLFDRYTLDGAVPSGMPLSLAGRLSRRIQRRLCPLPDLVIVLDASGATLHRRSGEYDPQLLETWRAAYGRLRGSVAALEVIDAEQPAEAVRRQAEARIWQRYGEIRSAAVARRRRRPAAGSRR